MPLNVVPNATPTRAFQPSGIGLDQAIHDTRYATLSIAAGAIPAVTRFFSGAPSSDPCSDRYEQGNTLFSSGNEFTIVGIGAQLASTAASCLTDMEMLIDYCALRLVTAQKEYGVFPLYMLPQGGGLQAFGGQVAVTPAAAPGGLSFVGATNGMPTRSAMFTLACPLIIQANQAFYAELLGPSGSGAFAVQTLTAAVKVRIVLDGVVKRTAA